MIQTMNRKSGKADAVPAAADRADNAMDLLPDDNLEEVFIRPASGPGGQHVNKTSCGVRLTFDFVNAAAIPEDVREHLLVSYPAGKIVIVSKETRSLTRNRELARIRLKNLLNAAFIVPQKRKKTKVPHAQKEQRRNDKARRAAIKNNRKQPGEND